MEITVDSGSTWTGSQTEINKTLWLLTGLKDLQIIHPIKDLDIKNAYNSIKRVVSLYLNGQILIDILPKKI